jgi:CheY-like chemotaxis protein
MVNIFRSCPILSGLRDHWMIVLRALVGTEVARETMYNKTLVSNRRQEQEEGTMITTPRVLVVDDEAPVRRQLKVGLAQHGYEVEESEEGLQALAKIKTACTKNPFQFVVLDIRLPDIDGLKILQAIKGTYPDLPVVVISGYGNESTPDTVESKKGSVYLDKPFDVDTLIAELNRIAPPVGEEAKPLPEAPPKVKPLESATVFIKGKADVDVYGMYMKLCFAEGVCYCDPLVGDWDMVLLVQASDRDGLDQLVKRHVEALEEVETFEVHHSERPRLPKEYETFIQDYERMQAAGRAREDEADKRKPRMLTTYAVLDVDPERLPLLYMKLSFTDNVVHFDVTDDGKKMILLLQGGLVQDIQATVRNEIRLMPGVLRIKVMNALNFWTK